MEKLFFRLVVTDDYPPVSSESVWAERLASGAFIVRNIPFYSKDACLDDEVLVKPGTDGEHYFERVTTSSGNSTIRIIFFDADDKGDGFIFVAPSKVALKDGHGASAQDMAASKIGGGSRKGQSACRKKLIAKSKPVGVYKCWRCGQTSTNPDDMHLGHKNVATSNGGNLADVNVDLEGASCNLSAGNSGYVKEGMSCVERGSCGAPYGR